MRTTLIIPDALLDEARAALGFRSKTDTWCTRCGKWSDAAGPTS